MRHSKYCTRDRVFQGLSELKTRCQIGDKPKWLRAAFKALQPHTTAHTRRFGNNCRSFLYCERAKIVNRSFSESQSLHSPHSSRLKEQTNAKTLFETRLYLLSPVYRTYSTEIPGVNTATSRFIAHQACILYHIRTGFAIGLAYLFVTFVWTSFCAAKFEKSNSISQKHRFGNRFCASSQKSA